MVSGRLNRGSMVGKPDWDHLTSNPRTAVGARLASDWTPTISLQPHQGGPAAMTLVQAPWPSHTHPSTHTLTHTHTEKELETYEDRGAQCLNKRGGPDMPQSPQEDHRFVKTINWWMDKSLKVCWVYITEVRLVQLGRISPAGARLSSGSVHRRKSSQITSFPLVTQEQGATSWQDGLTPKA